MIDAGFETYSSERMNTLLMVILPLESVKPVSVPQELFPLMFCLIIFPAPEVP